MKKGMFLTAAAVLALTSLSATGAHAGKTRDIVAPLSVTASPAANADELADLWVDGRRQEMAGLAQMEDGEKLLRSGQKDERKATEKLAKAAAVSGEQRAAYMRLVAGFGGASMPSAVETEIKALKKAADDWSDAYKRVEKAKAKLAAAQADVANGQSMIRTGNEQTSAGRDKMRRAETQSRPDFQMSDPAEEFSAPAAEFEPMDLDALVELN